MNGMPPYMSVPATGAAPIRPTGMLPMSEVTAPMVYSDRPITSVEELESGVAPASARPKRAQSTGPLSAYLSQVFDRHQQHRDRVGISSSFTTAVLDYMGKYSPEKLQELTQAGMPDVFIALTAGKCRSGIAWLQDVFAFRVGGRPWALYPTPQPDVAAAPAGVEGLTGPGTDAELMAVVEEIMGGETPAVEAVPPAGAGPEGLPPEAMPPEEPGNVASLPGSLPPEPEAPAVDPEAEMRRAALKAAQRQQRIIEDQLLEGGFDRAFCDFLFNLIVHKTAILRGPVVVNRRRKKWGPPDPATGIAVMETEVKPSIAVFSVSPQDAFPAPNASGFEHDFVERQWFTRSNLAACLKAGKYNKDEVRAALREFDALMFAPAASASTGDVDRAVLENKPTPGSSLDVGKGDPIPVLAFWVNVPGRLLLEDGWTKGPDGKPIDADLAYDLECYKAGPRLLLAEFNPDPLGRKPYSSLSWSPIPGSFWGQSVVEILADLQKAANASVRAAVYSASFVGPQFVVNDIRRLADGESLRQWVGGRILQFNNPYNSPAPPITTMQVNNDMAESLMAMFEVFMRLADPMTGIPAYNFGADQATGVGRTFAGLSVLLSSAAKGIKRVILDIDRQVMRPMLNRLYDWNLQNTEGFATDGTDVQISAAGAVAIMAQEAMTERLLEFMRVTAANPLDMKIIGTRKRARMIEHVSQTLDVLPGGEPLVEDPDEVERRVKSEDAAAMKSAREEAGAKIALDQSRAYKAKADADARMASVQQKQESDRAKLELQAQAQMLEAQLKQLELRAREAELALRERELEAKINKLGADADLSSARASAEVSNRVDDFIDRSREAAPAPGTGDFVAPEPEPGAGAGAGAGPVAPGA